MKIANRILAALTVAIVLLGMSCTVFAAENDVRTIQLTSSGADNSYTHSATLDGEQIPEYDYTWHADPTAVHEEVKNSPAEYYTGTKPEEDVGVYIAHDIYYYPLLEESKFQKVSYDGETEWAYFYEAPGYEDYIFSTLPVQKNGFPTQMMHSAEEAYANAVLHINVPGTYRLEGTWHGQIRVDLTEDAFTDPSCKVTLILNGVDITCSVASGVVFANVYECDNAWEERQTHSQKTDTSDAGANVVIADGTVNNVSGTNIFRILKTQFKDEDSKDQYPAQKKRLKTDGAFYSYQSMNITGGTAGDGVLNITAGYEGLNTELHLTLNGGNVNIYSQDDGINVNEDGVSVLTVNGGSLHICAGLGTEGDGVDSNGYLVINGGTVISSANPGADSGLDSDCGSFVNGGTVVALGSTMDWAEADQTAQTTQAVLNLRFAGSQDSTEAIVITDTDDKVVFAYDPDKDEVTGTNQRTYSGAIVSASGLQVGGTYRIYVGGNVEGSEKAGVYDAATVTGFTDAAQQCYSGNSVGGMGGGFRPQNRPDDLDGQQQRPQGDRENMTPPEGMENFKPDKNGNVTGFFGQGQQGGATCAYTKDFALSQTVNAFASVTDYRHDLQKAEGEDHYVCGACGSTFADGEGTVQLTVGTGPQKQEVPTVWGYVLCFLAGVITATAVFGVIYLLRKKKQ